MGITFVNNYDKIRKEILSLGSRMLTLNLKSATFYNADNEMIQNKDCTEHLVWNFGA